MNYKYIYFIICSIFKIKLALLLLIQNTFLGFDSIVEFRIFQRRITFEILDFVCKNDVKILFSFARQIASSSYEMLTYRSNIP